MDTISTRLVRDDMGDAAKRLMLTLGSNVEGQWMRSVDLGVTNWTVECFRSGGSCTFLQPSCGRSRCTALVWAWSSLHIRAKMRGCCSHSTTSSLKV
jgi:hypothetical protein